MDQKTIHRSSERNKQLILRTAAELFLRKGYTATTLREIAKESGKTILLSPETRRVMGEYEYISAHVRRV